MAVLLALPVGILGSYLTGVINTLALSAESITTKFIVIQNLIAVSSDSLASIENVWGDPIFWLGILGFFTAAGALILINRIIFHRLQLQKQEQQLTFVPLSQISDLSKSQEAPLIAFSDEVQIPFTYGWFQTKIVIPSDLKEEPEALEMAIQHELMHIKHNDFLLNGILVTIKALFWIHPLIHYFYNTGQEYREITCDGEVLANNQFSKKRYAALLYKLAARERTATLAMSMAVNPSSLKKRIQIMSSQSTYSVKFRTSFFLTMVLAALLVLMMACSDMTDNGLTVNEVKQAQSKMQTSMSENARLFLVNGEKATSDEIQKLSRIKPKYIKSMNVTKGEEAIKKYGDDGKDGVVDIVLLDKEKAYSDLEDKSGIKNKSQDDYYVAVEKMPELIGGLEPLQREITYPEETRKKGIEGRVIIQFIVDKEGNVENPQVIKGIGAGCDEEALRVVKNARFKPGTQSGQAVEVQYSLPIQFVLQSASGEEG